LKRMSNRAETKQLTALGKRIASIRRERGMTQEQLAERTGFTVITIGYIEQGRRSPRIATLHKIAAGLGVPIIELFRGI
jgi:transcriptional regulator with XRE-family HTH domain